MSEPTVDRDPFEVVAELFLERYRTGQQPSIVEFAARYPELAKQIRELLPALVMVEQDLTIDPDPDGGQPPRADSPGKERRLGDYRILREIGRGGMGVVYEAEQVSLGRRVALKVLPGHLAGNQDGLERFRREARAAAKLHHANIVPVYEVGQDRDVRFYAMQFIQGESLDQVINELRRLRDRSGPDPRVRSFLKGRPLRPSGEHSLPATASPAPVEEVEVSAVLRSILAGRFDPGGRPPEPVEDLRSRPAGDLARNVTTQPGIEIEPGAAESGPVLKYTEVDTAIAGDNDDPERAHPPESGLSSTAPSSSSSAILPGGTQLSSAESGRHAFYRSLAQIGRQVAGGLTYAHARGIVHRDIKPSNLLLDTEGVVWITDFGVAKGDDEGLSQTGDILGTIRYMAPERFRGEGDARADVYALGLTLYELLALRPGFAASDRLELIERIKTEEPHRPRSIDGRIPRDLETIVLKAIEKDPKARYQSAQAMGEDLGRFLADEPIRARQVRAAERVGRWARRNPVVAIAAGLSASLLIAVAGLSLLYAGQQTRHAAEQAKDTAKITDLAKTLEKESQDLKSALSQSNRRLAVLNIERALASSERGKIGPGLLSMVESLRAATAATDTALKNSALANLSAWQRHYPRLKGVFSQDGSILSVAFSPDGRSVLTGSFDRTARLWDAATGNPIGQPMVHPNVVKSVAFSPDGKTILTGSYDGKARLWDAASGRLIGRPLEHRDFVWAVAFSPDGKLLLTGSFDKTARLWDAATGRKIGKPLEHPATVLAVAFSPAGKTLVTGSSDGKARVWSVDTGQPIGNPLEHPDQVSSIAFSPDGKTILTGCYDNTARLWDAATGCPIGKSLEHRGYVRAVAFSPDGKIVLTGSHDKTARLWDTASGQPVGGLVEHQGIVLAVAFSPDGKSILTGSTDGTTRMCDATPGLPVGKPLLHQGRVCSVAFSPDGGTLLTGSDDKMARLWDAASGRQLGKPLDHHERVWAVAFGPDGKSFVTASVDGHVRFWSTASGQPVGPMIQSPDAVNAVAFSPDGKSIVTGGRDSSARLWDAFSGLPRGKPLEHQSQVWAVAFSRDGKTVLTGSWDKTARLWDVRSGRPVGKPLEHRSVVWAAAFSPDGKTIVTGSDDRIAQFWDAASFRPIGRPLEHQGSVLAVAFSSDGKFVLTGSDDNTARLWDVSTRQPIGPPMTHRGQVRSVAFSPDGKTMLTASYDSTARLWETPAQLPDNLPRLSAWVESVTGLELDEQGSVRALKNAAWQERRDRLSRLGGSP